MSEKLITVKQVNPEQPEVYKLIQDLDHYLIERYPAESNHLDSIKTLQAQNVAVFAAYVNLKAKACGAIKLMQDDGNYGEVKRVYVSPDSRGLGLAKKIMQALENFALANEFRIIRLETGTEQPESIGLYQKLGYNVRDAFADYPEDDPYCVFMEKTLSVDNLINSET